jgi:multicomponent Na+:H+ antiporter subunit E
MTLRPLLWFVAFSGLWWMLVGGGFEGWYAALLGVAGATAILASLARRSSPRIRVTGVLGFLPFVMREGVAGGIDVSRRALSPSLPLSPDLLEYEVRLPVGPARSLFVNTVSLLPGTFSAQLKGPLLTIHLLTSEPETAERIAELESRAGRVFGIMTSARAAEANST